MDYEIVSRHLIAYLGGKENILKSQTCMTRLHVDVGRNSVSENTSEVYQSRQMCVGEIIIFVIAFMYPTTII